MVHELPEIIFSYQQITRDDTAFLSRSVFLSHADSNENEDENENYH